ncbi:MAG TPA: hypothetical protein VNH16_01835 [Burkholderiales bacterium]|jgi:hypothetical protein|nr:hypothetical protein [Burkholderiales bacterium]
MKKTFVLPLLALAGGCAQAPYWTLTDDANRVLKSTSFEMTMPAGWTRTTTADTWEQVKVDDKQQTLLLEAVTASRDGVAIQAITVTRRYADTAFPTLKKKTNANMQPIEAADLYVSELRKRYGLERLRVVSNKPTQINGHHGFELVMEFKNDDGLRIRIVSNGFVDKTGFYTINYRAPVLYYFDRDYADYTKLVRSFRQSKGAFDPPPEIPGWAKLFT